MVTLNKYLILLLSLIMISCVQKQGSSSFKTLGKISDGSLSFSYSGATGTVGMINTTMTITPTELNSVNSNISNCRIKSGTINLPSGFVINPVTCVIVGVPITRLYPTFYTIEAINSMGIVKEATVILEAQTFYNLTGTISGLPSGQNVTISNGVDTLIQSNNGSFSLTPIMQSTSYHVTVAEGNPNRFTCSISNGSGTANSNVTNISISCVPSGTRVLSGSISGLLASSTLLLSTNSQNITVTANGSFSFPAMNYGTSYSVSVVSVSGSQTCVVASSTGTLIDDINSVSVVCQYVAPNTYTLVGTVVGLTAGQSVTVANGADSHNITNNGTFVLNSIVSGASYNVTATASDTSTFTCTVANGSGIISSNVSNIQVSCTMSGTRTLAGTISGLTNGAVISLTTNGTTLSSLSNGSFSFTTLAYGTSYNLSVSSVTTGYACAITNGSGILTANTTNISLSCGPLGPYSINVTISGISSGTISLSQGTDTIPNSTNGSFTFATQQYYGTNYNVLVTSTPAAHTCSVSNGSGSVTGTMSVTVTCTPTTYNLGGTYSGLYSGESVVLSVNSLNGVTSETLSGVVSGVSTGFTFPNGLTYNQTYNVQIVSQPANRICTLTNGSGLITNNTTNIGVTCTARAAGDCSFGSVTPWRGNGNITGMYCDGTYMYVAGSFTGMGPRINFFAGINNTDTHPIPDSRVPAIISSGIYSRVIETDGEGGWYIGGSNSKSDSYVKHLKSDYSIDANFSTTIAYVQYFKVIGNYLYVCTSVSPYIYRLNRFTGATDSGFSPNVNGPIYSMEYDGTNLYMGGSFTIVGGNARFGVAKINAVTGSLVTTFIANTTNDAAQTTLGGVKSIKLYNNNLYIGGTFSYLNGNNSYPNLAKTDINGIADSTFTPSPNSTITGLTVSSGKLLVVGSFTTIASVSKKYLAALDLSTNNSVTSFFGETISSGSMINFIHFDDVNNLLYLGLSNSAIINGNNRNYYAVYDLTNKTLSPQQMDFNTTISTIATYQDQVFIGGAFTLSYKTTQNYFARIKLSDGSLDTSFTPVMNSGVAGMTYDSTSNSLFLAGSFTTPTYGIAKWNLTTQSWDTSFAPPVTLTNVNKVLVYNSKLYTIGNFTTPRKYFAVFDKTSGAFDSTYPDVAPNGIINDMIVNSNGVFLGGAFTSIDSSTTESQYLAQLDISTGQHTPNYFIGNPNNAVSSLTIFNNNLLVGGTFTSFNGDTTKSTGIRFNIGPSSAALDSGFVSSLAAVSGNTENVCSIGTTQLFSTYSPTLNYLNTTTGTAIAGPVGMQQSFLPNGAARCFSFGNHVFVTDITGFIGVGL